MPTTSITFRTDEDLKKRFEEISSEMGMPMTGLLNAFVKATVREGKLPFELASDEYAYHQMICRELDKARKEAKDPNTKWLTHDEVFGKFKEKYGYDIRQNGYSKAFE
ncbi:MAG: type II toxin-antitoxin system RelB/DinJ family antitoxin [Oscillospiraceae bacterium]|nr:type II toxin-antitoxin system RelB/DinJ family antitoxin [Oscillospiraceae bacterium]